MYSKGKGVKLNHKSSAALKHVIRVLVCKNALFVGYITGSQPFKYSVHLGTFFVLSYVESSSYGGSDSEDLDWAPAEDSENVGELLAEAKSFTDNKKMRKPI